MSLVYRFRVTFEEYDEVSRDIDILSSQTFEDLHHTIQASIGFDDSKLASFYMSNDLWIKGQEISLEKRKDKNGQNSALMRDSKLCNFIADPHQKIYYISDYDASWSFFMELVKILPSADMTKSYPVCVKVNGESPKQYNVVARPVVVDEEFDALQVEEDLAPEEDVMVDETEDGVEMDEIAGMSEEGEEEVEKDEEMEEEASGEETKEEDY